MKKPFQYRLLTNFTDFTSFECRVPSVNAFIHDGLQEASIDNQCETYGVYDGKKLIAFFALKHDERFIDAMGNHSALEISFLAVCREYELQGIGKSIIQKIIQIALTKKTEYKYLTVEALVITHPKKERYEAVSFYKKCMFRQAELYSPAKNTLSMYLRFR